MEEASYLMDRPPGGWSELVTNHTLDLTSQVIDQRFNSVEARMDAGFESLVERVDVSIATLRHELLAEMATLRHELRTEVAGLEAKLAWKLVSAVIAGMAVMGAVFAGLTSIAGG